MRGNFVCHVEELGLYPVEIRKPWQVLGIEAKGTKLYFGYISSSKMKSRLRGMWHTFGNREIHWEITTMFKCEMMRT